MPYDLAVWAAAQERLRQKKSIASTNPPPPGLQSSRRAWIRTKIEATMSNGDEYTPGIRRLK